MEKGYLRALASCPYETYTKSEDQPRRKASSLACSASSSDMSLLGASFEPPVALGGAGPADSPRATACRVFAKGDAVAMPVGVSVS
jgi:hypothetical protein